MVDETLTPNQMTSPEADIILACQEMIKKMESKPKLAWVRGHQDGKKKKKYEDLPTDAQVNIDMDDECDEERRKGKPLQVRPLKGSGAMLAINNRFITTNYKQNIHEAIMKGEHKRYFIKRYQKHGLTNKGYDKIAWKYVGRAKKRLPMKHISTVTKLQNS